MIDLKAARADPDTWRAALARKGAGEAFDTLLAADENWRSLVPRVDDLRSRTKLKGKPTHEQLEKMGYRPYPGDPEPTFFKPVGCSNCAKTGYKGRLALHEVMAMTDPIERLTVERESATKIMQVAVAEGMRTLREDGLLKASMGVTSLDEIFRVVA